jgi:hypothetical protein
MSQRESGYERKERDLYETPEWVSEVGASQLGPTGDGLVWEPACGSGKMQAVIQQYYDVIGSDIHLGRDFLTAGLIEPDVRRIMTNPPYELATEFCEHALRLMEPVGGSVLMLLRTDFDHAKSRSHLFRDCPAFAKKLVLMRRIAWFVEANGKPKASPSFNHAWYIWDWKHEGPPTIGYGP